MRFFVSPDHGGSGGSYLQFARTAATIASECASTAMIWVMHCQQNRVIADWLPRLHGRTIKSKMKDDGLIASVTTDPKSRGSLFSSDALLRPKSTAGWTFVRACPIVSYGAEATHYLMSISQEERSKRHTVLCLVDRGSVIIDDIDNYKTLGMRGTRTIGLTLSGVVSADAIITNDMRDVVIRSYNPTAAVGWSAVWYGAAWGAYHRALQSIRRSDDALAPQLPLLGEIRVMLNSIRSSIRDIAIHIDNQSRCRNWSGLGEADTTIALHSTKVHTSRACFRVADRLIDLVGFRDGYIWGSDLGIERTFRDLRSASLMKPNFGYVRDVGHLSVVEPRRPF